MVLLAVSSISRGISKPLISTARRSSGSRTLPRRTVGDEKQRKLVVWFTNDERGLLLNKTNHRTLSGAFGDNMEAWVGKIIVMFPTMADFRGKMVPALRVRIPPPKQPAAATSPASSGNGSAAAAPPPKVVPPTTALSTDDPELADEPKKPLADELDDEIPC